MIGGGNSFQRNLPGTFRYNCPARLLIYCSMRTLRTPHSDAANLRRTYRLAFMRLKDIWSSQLATEFSRGLLGGLMKLTYITLHDV
eukprot:scaffold13839_cov82-Cylindrotheca_fusiformis.AAC.2